MSAMKVDIVFSRKTAESDAPNAVIQITDDARIHPNSEPLFPREWRMVHEIVATIVAVRREAGGK